MDEQLLIRLAQIAIRCVVAYYVYKDAVKNEVPNRNFWVAATFVFWPVIVAYLFYRQRAARTVDLSFEQKAQLEIDHKREEEKRRIAAERARMEIERKHEIEKNQISEEQLEKLRQERKRGRTGKASPGTQGRQGEAYEGAGRRACRTGKAACGTFKNEGKKAAGYRGKESRQSGKVVGYSSLQALRV